MKIMFSREGGFIGALDTIVLDTEDLPEDIQDKVSEFVSTNISHDHDPRARDHMKYTLEILNETGNKKQVFTEPEIKAKFAPLIEYLKSRLEKL